jgi:hypothetical protein
MSLHDLMVCILDNCCSNPSKDSGWNEYYVETHCVAYTITAQKVNGKWIIGAVNVKPC